MSRFLSILFVLCIPVLLFGQDTIPGSEVRVEKLFDARLAEAQRINLKPSLPELDTTTEIQEYNAVPVKSEISYEPPKIRPLAVKVEAPAQAYKGFTRIGGGFPAAWIGDVGYATRNETIALRGDLHSYGIQGNQFDDQIYNEVNGLLGGTFYAPSGLAFDLDIDYDRRSYRYYGFREAVSDTAFMLPEESLNQHFSVFGLRAGVRNAKPNDLGISYYLRGNGSFLSDNFSTKERNILFELGGRKDFGERWYAEAEIDIDLTDFNSATFGDNAAQTLNNYSFIPTVGSNFDAFGIRLGATISSSDDNFKFFPNAEISYNIGNGYVALLGADGGFKKNNYRAMTYYLPFLVNNPELVNAEEWRAYAKFQGQTRGINYEVTASYSRVNNIALFLIDSAELYKFTPTFDTAGIFNLRIQASAPLADRFTGRMQVDIRSFTLNQNEKPFLLPSFEATFQAAYEVIPEKFTASASMNFQNSLPVGFSSGVTGVGEDLTGALFDLSVSGDYWINLKLAAFGQLNNLFNNRRREFPFYPIVGTNFLVGVKARF